MRAPENRNARGEPGVGRELLDRTSSNNRTELPTQAGLRNAAAQSFVLPWPVSTNSLWRAVRGRNILSERARIWAKHAAQELMIQRAKSIKGPVSVLIELCHPTNHIFDLDNFQKCCLDLLVGNHVIEADDSRIVKEVIARVGAHTGVRVTVTPIGAA
jgi:Holliday junction resolvase RusA-like endonuclease